MMERSGAFIRKELAPERPAPMRMSGWLAWVSAHLFNSPLNALMTVAGLAAIVVLTVPMVQFLLIDAVWTGSSREACLESNVGHPVGACWPFIWAKLTQLFYGFYPESERWRANLTGLLAAMLLLPLLIPRVPRKGVNAALFFIAFPVVAFFLLHGGGLNGFGIAALNGLGTGVGQALIGSGENISEIGRSLPGLIEVVVVAAGSMLALAGKVVLLLWMPIGFLRDILAEAPQPFWADVVLTGIVVTIALTWFFGGLQNGLRVPLTTMVAFAVIGIVAYLLKLDRGGLPVVDTRQWGGMLVTLVVSVTGIVASMPIGIFLALGRRSRIPVVRILSVLFIEFWRGVPLITVIFFATYMLPLFLPGEFTVDNLLRVLVGVSIFAGAYNAEVIRGGLQAIPRGQSEAAKAMGLSYWKATGLIVMPQALKHVIPSLVNSFIALFKDTTLVLIVAIFDLLGQLRAAFADPNWATPTVLFTGFAFIGMIYFAFCFGMSRYSLFVERRLNTGRRG